MKIKELDEKTILFYIDEGTRYIDVKRSCCVDEECKEIHIMCNDGVTLKYGFSIEWDKMRRPK